VDRMICTIVDSFWLSSTCCSSVLSDAYDSNRCVQWTSVMCVEFILNGTFLVTDRGEFARLVISVLCTEQMYLWCICVVIGFEFWPKVVKILLAKHFIPHTYSSVIMRVSVCVCFIFSNSICNNSFTDVSCDCYAHVVVTCCVRQNQ
jgi:hypothetical protein